MPDATHMLAFFLAALVLAAIPGPGLLYVLARSLGGGRDVGLRSSLGTGLGGRVHVLAAAAGLSALLASSASAFLSCAPSGRRISSGLESARSWRGGRAPSGSRRKPM
jgi:threonine/homoserine/homoserine lactone efflux protein